MRRVPFPAKLLDRARERSVGPQGSLGQNSGLNFLCHLPRAVSVLFGHFGHAIIDYTCLRDRSCATWRFAIAAVPLLLTKRMESYIRSGPTMASTRALPAKLPKSLA